MSTRVRYDKGPCYYHLLNRIAGRPDDLPFGDVEKEHFFDLVLRLSRLYAIDLISVVVMSNHFHIVCMARPDLPDLDEIRRRWRAFYTYRARLGLEPDWKNPAVVEHWARRLRDISEFMKDLQQRFTRWYNRTHDRHGRLWADRYKNVILESGRAVYRCIQYVEMNPVRAGLCTDPGEYRFSTFGRYMATGRHPFAESAVRHLRIGLSHTYGTNQVRGKTDEEILAYFRGNLAALTTMEAGGGMLEIRAARLAAEKGSGFVLTTMRRVRYWSDGAIIGSKAFVREIAAAHWGKSRAGKKRLALARLPGVRQGGRRGPRAGADVLYAWRYLKQ